MHARLTSSNNNKQEQRGAFNTFVRQLAVEFLSGFLGTGISLVRLSATQLHLSSNSHNNSDSSSSSSKWSRVLLKPLDMALFSLQYVCDVCVKYFQLILSCCDDVEHL
jgi:hypothetical protein